MLVEVTTDRDVRRERSEPRMKVFLSAELGTGRGQVSCRVLDLSRGGACIEADQPQSRGTRIELRRGLLNVAGTVVWSRGRRFGMQFGQAIRATDLFVQMSASRKAQPEPRITAGAIPPFPSR